MGRKTRRAILTHVLLIVICFMVLLPVLFALSKSTQTRAQVFHYPPKLGPGTALVKNYRTAWNDFGLGLYMRNSLIIAGIVMIAKTILSMISRQYRKGTQ